MLFYYGEQPMATILEFKIPEKKDQDEIIDTPVVMSSVNDVMLIIHHAIHGSDDSYQPTDRKLAAQLLDELSVHIKENTKSESDECVMLSNGVSRAILERYPC